MILVGSEHCILVDKVWWPLYTSLEYLDGQMILIFNISEYINFSFVFGKNTALTSVTLFVEKVIKGQL